MNENKSKELLGESIKPFTMDLNYASQQNMMQAMVPGSESTKTKNVADELNVGGEKSVNKTVESKPEKSENEVKEKTSVAKALIKPFQILAEGAQDPNHKLYLVLVVNSSMEDNVEDDRDFFFVKGRQAVFDKIRLMLESGEPIDIMRSLIYVDSNKVKISMRTSVYRFMRDCLNTSKVINDSGFDIGDYYYDYEYEERTEIVDGEEI